MPKRRNASGSLVGRTFRGINGTAHGQSKEAICAPEAQFLPSFGSNRERVRRGNDEGCVSHPDASFHLFRQAVGIASHVLEFLVF